MPSPSQKGVLTAASSLFAVAVPPPDKVCSTLGFTCRGAPQRLASDGRAKATPSRPCLVQALVLRHGAFYLRGPRAEALWSWQYVGASDFQSRPNREKRK